MDWRRSAAATLAGTLAAVLTPLQATAADSNVDVTLSPEQVDFGHLPRGSAVNIELVVTNTGTVEAVLGGISLGLLKGHGGFSSMSGEWLCPIGPGGPHLAPGESCAFTMHLIVAGHGRGTGDLGVEAYGTVDGQFELETSTWHLVVVGTRAQS